MELFQKWRKKMLKINNLTSLIFILIISITLGYVSFTGGTETTSEAYLFPKLITFVMIILSSFSLFFYFMNKTSSVANIDIKKLSVYLFSLILFIFLGEIIGLLQSPAKNVISALQSGGKTLSGIVKTLSER